jgi:hypothetical protein
MNNYCKTTGRKYSVEGVCIGLIVATGVLFSLLQFFYNRSFWWDDASLALNIIGKNYFELLKPLDYEQVAPVLFLYIEKFFSTLWPNTEYGLRIFPLLCFWASIYFFYKILKMQLHNVYAIIFALSLYIFNYTLFFYTNEVKQYISDVLVLIIIFYFILKNYKTTRNKYYVLGIAGVIAIFGSNVAPIILSTCGLYLLYDQIYVRKNKKMGPLFVIFSVWLFFFLLYYIFFVHNHPLREFMVRYWLGYGAFPTKGICIFFIGRAIMINGMLSSEVSGFFLIVFLIAGFITLIKNKKTDAIILTCIPVTLHTLLSIFHLYPFDTRLILYTLPCIILIYSFGLDFILKIVFSRLKIERCRLLAVIIPLPFLLVFLFGKHPVKVNYAEIKPSLRYIQENITEGENIYVSWAASRAFKYYKEIGFIKMDTLPIEGEWDKSKEEVEKLRKIGGRSWILFTNIYQQYESAIINELESVAHKEKEFKTIGSSVYLYNFEK